MFSWVEFPPVRLLVNEDILRDVVFSGDPALEVSIAVASGDCLKVMRVTKWATFYGI